MFSSFTSISNPFSVPRILRRKSTSIDLPSVQIHDVEIDPDKRARTLKHLLKLNHAQHSIIYHDLHFHNHMPHILGSAYILSGNADHLQEIYEADSKHLEPWRDSPREISDYDWRDYLGDPHYQRAYVDFFEDQLVQSGYDWRAVLKKYLFEGKQPLFNNLISGLGHCLIHLGYAHELSSREVAMEALGLTCCFYNFMHKYLDEPFYTRPPSSSSLPTSKSSTPGAQSASTLEILHNIREDKRFDDLAHEPGSIGLEDLFNGYEAAVLDHWNSWDVSTNPREQFHESQRTVVALLVGTHYPPPPAKKEYDFFLVHLLTTSHAVRVLLPLLEPEWHLPLVRQWWLFVCAVYVMQGRPKIEEGRFAEGELGEGRDWTWVRKQAVEGKWRLDEHFVKALRAMMVAGETWGHGGSDEGARREEYYLKAAVTMAEEYGGWGGFGAMGVEEGKGGHETKKA